MRHITYKQIKRVINTLYVIRRDCKTNNKRIKTTQQCFDIKFEDTKYINYLFKKRNIFIIALIICKIRYGAYIYETNKELKLI